MYTLHNEWSLLNLSVVMSKPKIFYTATQWTTTRLDHQSQKHPPGCTCCTRCKNIQKNARYTLRDYIVLKNSRGEIMPVRTESDQGHDRKISLSRYLKLEVTDRHHYGPAINFEDGTPYDPEKTQLNFDDYLAMHEKQWALQVKR